MRKKEWDLRFIGLHGESDTLHVIFEEHEKRVTFMFYVRYPDNGQLDYLFGKSFRKGNPKISQMLFALDGPIGTILRFMNHGKP